MESKITGHNSFFREDYNNEVNGLLEFSAFKNIAYHDAGNFLHHLKSNPNVTSRLLQHLYSNSNSIFLYKQLKDISELDKELINCPGESAGEIRNKRDILISKFRKEYESFRLGIKFFHNPDFGACSVCIEGIKLKKLEKYKKILKGTNDAMWNLFS